MKHFAANIFRLAILLSFLLEFNCVKANFHFQSTIDSPSLIGRWDMTLYIDGNSYPSWLEVQLSGYKTLVGQYVGTGGSARPISKIIFNNGSFTFFYSAAMGKK